MSADFQERILGLFKRIAAKNGDLY